MSPEEENKILKEAIKEIAKTCPLIGKDKDAMYGPDSSTLFLHSTVRRMEIAKKALTDLESKTL
jgi:hypothetical protein